jgi:thiamine kinase
VQGETDHCQNAAGPGEPPAGLVAFWRARRADLFPVGARWQALSGGRTNAVWHITGGSRPLVVKLYREAAHTPLFANDADAEAASLAALAGTRLAPELVAVARTPAGRSLVYTHVAGRPWASRDDPAPVAAALARLHGQPLPEGLPHAPLGPDRLRAEALAMCDDIGAIGAGIAAQVPRADVADDTPHAVFIHGDATAANTLVTPAGVTFIDWQCPAIGDPADDLAVFLSPAMQIVSGNPPLTPAQEAAFLAAYASAAPDGTATIARYRGQARLYHARMGAYAMWRAARGDGEYAAAARAEIARLTATG